MKNNHIKDVVDSLSPSDNQKNRIYNTILSKNNEKKKQFGKSYKTKIVVAAFACLTIAVIGILISTNIDPKNDVSSIPSKSIFQEHDIETTITNLPINDKPVLDGFILTAYSPESLDSESIYLSTNYKEETKKQVMVPDAKILLAQYTPLLSSVPGFPFTFDVSQNNSIDIETLRLTVDNGYLIDWNRFSGEITVKDSPLIINTGKTLYWSPISDSDSLVQNASITVEAVIDGVVAGKQTIYISQFEEGYYYATVGELTTF